MTILAGTQVEVEVAQGVRPGDINEGGLIKFCVARPLIVDGAVVITAGTTATARIVEKKVRQFGPPGLLARVEGQVIAVDGTPVPLRSVQSWVGDTRPEVPDAQTVVISSLFFPAGPIAVLYDCKRRGYTQVSREHRYHAITHKEVTVCV